MQSFELHIPTKFYFGDTYLTKFCEHVCKKGTNVCIVIGGGSVKRLGYLDQVTGELQKLGASILICEGIEANPDAETINHCAASARSFKADVVLALGGGSVMDAAKAIAALAYSGTMRIFCTRRSGAIA